MEPALHMEITIGVIVGLDGRELSVKKVRTLPGHPQHTVICFCHPCILIFVLQMIPVTPTLARTADPAFLLTPGSTNASVSTLGGEEVVTKVSRFRFKRWLSLNLLVFRWFEWRNFEWTPDLKAKKAPTGIMYLFLLVYTKLRLFIWTVANESTPFVVLSVPKKCLMSPKNQAIF